MTTDPQTDLTARIAAKKAEPHFQELAKTLSAAVPLGIVQAQVLHDAAAEIAAMDPAEAALAGQYAFHNAAAQLHRRANEAEFAATPCDAINPCEDGGDPCHVHERLMSHYDGSHELCEPDCETAAPAVSSPLPDQTLRDRIAEALYRHDWPLKQIWAQGLPGDRKRYTAMADAVLAVLPPAADRAAVYAEVADRLAVDAEQGAKEGFTRIYRRSAAKQVREWAEELPARPASQPPADRSAVLLEAAAALDGLTQETASADMTMPEGRWRAGLDAGVRELRRLAAEASPVEPETLAPAATCSAQYHGTEEVRHCIRAAQHTGKAHTDANGFHWSDTVAVYPVADGSFRTGINVQAELRRLAAEAQQPDGRKTGTAFSPGEGVHGQDPYYDGAEARQPDGYEATTGHLITCFAVAGGNPDPDCSCATEAQQPDTRPRRGDQFEAWLKAQRDGWEVTSGPQWGALDDALDTYRLHADTGTPLSGHVCEGRAVGDCECLEPATPVQPAADGSGEEARRG